MKQLLVLPIVLSLLGCTTEPPDYSLASKAFLCESYQYWIRNKRFAQPFADELKRRGEDCKDYERSTNVEIEIK